MKEFKLLRSGIKRKIDTIHKLRKKVTKENIYKVTNEIEENTSGTSLAPTLESV